MEHIVQQLKNIKKNKMFVENFDIISKFTYSKKFKVKAKIKSISKFIPKINID